MSDVNLNDICVSAFGDVMKVIPLIEKISEGEVRAVTNDKDFGIFRIKTAAGVKELKDYLVMDNVSLMIFEVGEQGTLHMDDPIIMSEIMGGYDDDFIQHHVTTPKAEEEPKDVSDWTKNEVGEKIDELLEIGVKNLTVRERELLDKLSKQL